MTILDRIKRWLNPPRYQIVHEPQYGYCAYWRNAYGSWQAIRSDGTDGMYMGGETTIPSMYFTPTIEAAGERINRHSNNRGRSVVWTEPTT